MKIHFLFLCLGLFLLQSCLVNDAKEPKKQFVNVYTDVYCKQDEANFKKFFKEQKIKVYVHLVSPDTLQNFLKSKKFNAEVDLIILSDYTKILELSAQHHLLPLHSEKLKSIIDPLYRSKYDKWFALSKTPLVLAYNEKVLRKDTVVSYYDLVFPKWQGKIAMQNLTSPTQIAFKRNMRSILRGKSDAFLGKFYKQGQVPFLKDDDHALYKVEANQAQLALVKLSSLARFQNDKKDKNRFDLGAIFPNQRKKGCYFTITASAVYRYANNPLQAKALLEFLASKKAQYAFAEGRYEFPIIKGVKAHYLLESYGKFRGRFFKGKS